MKKALFLDRDGIINVDYGYVYKIENFKFTNGIFDLLKLFIKLKYQLFIVTNQSGIGRDYYTQKDFNKLTKWMLKEFKKHNINIKALHFCPHSPELNCQCRKPKTGMIDEILSQNSIDLKNSWMIGDKPTDIELADNANITNSIYIGAKSIPNATLSFKTILETLRYLEENQGKIL